MSINRIRRIVVAGLVLLALSVTVAAQARVETNVVYGMYSGTALLLDVHYPEQPNGFGIVFIPGSGWNAPLGYSAAPLEESPQVEDVRAFAHASGIHRVCPSHIVQRRHFVIRRLLRMC